jgi:hypothetical protein
MITWWEDLDQEIEDAEEFAAALDGLLPARPALQPLMAVVQRLELHARETRERGYVTAGVELFARTAQAADLLKIEYRTPYTVEFTPAGNPVHHGGSGSSYTNYGCRCDECTEANTARAHRRHLQRRGEQPPADAHGQLSTYVNWWCRCPGCREAAALDRSERSRRLLRLKGLG